MKLRGEVSIIATKAHIAIKIIKAVYHNSKVLNNVFIVFLFLIVNNLCFTAKTYTSSMSTLGALNARLSLAYLRIETAI